MFICTDELTGRFTFEAEGSTDPSNPYFIGKLSHPSSVSGVTIGAGYDMGERNGSAVKTDLINSGASAQLAAQMAEGAGLTGRAAEQFVKDNRAALMITDIAVLRRLFMIIYPGYVQSAHKSFDFHMSSFQTLMPTYGKQYKDATPFAWKDLFPSMRVMATDFIYQGFGAMKKHHGRPMHFCMANNFDWLIQYITNTPELAQYEAGRRRAAYLRSQKLNEMLQRCQALPA